MKKPPHIRRDGGGSGASGMADGGPGEADRHPRGTERGAETLSEAGQREHGEEDHEQRGKTDQILHRAFRGVVQQGLHGVFHCVLHDLLLDCSHTRNAM